MSIRHIHARRGEHIKVHRDYNCDGGNSNDWSLMQILGLLLVGSFILWIIISIWQILLCLLLIAGSIWLVWTFRRPVWYGICKAYRRGTQLFKSFINRNQ